MASEWQTAQPICPAAQVGGALLQTGARRFGAARARLFDTGQQGAQRDKGGKIGTSGLGADPRAKIRRAGGTSERQKAQEQGGGAQHGGSRSARGGGKSISLCIGQAAGGA